MQEFRLDGRTAIVTGAGGNPSLGRAHALLLARRGANVVVNDIGKTAAPGYEDAASAQSVVDEIIALGGKAVADNNSVADVDGAKAIVQTALDAFGRLDILVNNAGFAVLGPFEDMDPRDYRRHYEVNLMGPTWTCLAAWPHMRAAGYGRIINITSNAMSGLAGMTAYGASKGGLFALTRGLAAEGLPHGIKVNAVNPTAFTRMIKATLKEGTDVYEFMKTLAPELVSPVVAYFAHEDCPVTGVCIEAGGGEVSELYFARTPGFSDPNLTIETLAERWREVASDDPRRHGIENHSVLPATRPYRREEDR